MITFIGFSYRSSGIIRGKQISSLIPDSDFVDVDRPTPVKNNLAIFVRKFDEAQAKRLKSQGKILGFDVADNLVTDFLYGRVEKDDFKRYTSEFLDFYIVNNDLMKFELSKATNKPIYVIPHHNCNFNRKINEVKKPARLGYVGMPEYTLDKKSLEDFCNKLGLTFVTSNPETHEKLEHEFSKIDIGVIFFKQDSIKAGVYERTLKYKPNTKLTNFQSFGIPTVCLPYESYKQFGENQCLFVNDENELKEQIVKLTNDNALYSSLSKSSITVAEKYHISNITNYYSKIVGDFR